MGTDWYQLHFVWKGDALYGMTLCPVTYIEEIVLIYSGNSREFYVHS
jgi:hypothetical protein